MKIEMRVRVVNLNADEQNLWCRCSVPAGSIVEEFREFVLSWRGGIEDECAFILRCTQALQQGFAALNPLSRQSSGVEGEFRCLPGGGRFR